jgi:L-rhamnose-H+ transport protein
LGANPFIGVIYHWIGGLASASNFIPFKGIRRWAWEVIWLVQGIFSWLIAPSVMAALFVPGVFQILASTSVHTLGITFLWGLLWGFGGLTFGLSIRYLGIALGYAIALGLCTIFGTLMPPLFSGQLGVIASERSGQIILAGLGVCILGIVVNGIAGIRKERELTDAQKKQSVGEFSFVKGLLVAIFSGIMSACFAYGLSSGKPISEVTRTHLVQSGRLELWQSLPVLIVITLGGLVTNVIWSLILIVKNRRAAEFLGHIGGDLPLMPARSLGAAAAIQQASSAARVPLLSNYFFAALAGTVWYFQFFFYSMGQTKMGKYDFSSWTLHMASIIIFSTLWGVSFKEWNGTRKGTKLLVFLGLFLLIGSSAVIGYGNYMKSLSPN